MSAQVLRPGPPARAAVRGATPGLVAVLLVAGGGMAAVVATSLGLMPLYGRLDPGLTGWSEASRDLGPALGETLLIALPATLLAALVGLLVAALVLAGGPGARLVRGTSLAVLAVPHLVGATSVGLLLADGGVAQRVLGPAAWPELVAGPWPWATVLALAWKESAFVTLVVVAALGADHRARMEAAAVLGARPAQRVGRVLLPAAAPALGAASLVVLVYAVGSYEVAWLLGRTTPEPLPVLAFRLFGSIELTDRPAAAAAAAVGAALALGLATAALAAVPGTRRALRPESIHDGRASVPASGGGP